MSKRVLFVGGEDHELRIPFLLALRDRGFHVAAAGTGDPAPFARVGLEYHGYSFGRFVAPWTDWQAIASLDRLFRDLRPDIVHCFDTKPNLLVPLAARRSGHGGVVRTINGMGWLYSTRAWAGLALRPAYRALHRIAAAASAATIFQNREDKAYFTRHGMLGGRAAKLIPGSGVDIAAFERARAAGPSSAELRRQLGLGGAEVVVTVTRLTRQKGIPTLLQAASLVHAVRPGVRFLLVGSREGEGRFAVPQHEIDAHAPYVVATGRRTDVPALLELADVFAFPTEYREGVPRAVLEAGLAGVPMVATRMPGCTDIVRDGWSGSLVPPRSPARLAGAILGLLQDRPHARAMGANAANLVRDEFSLELTLARYAAVYAEVLEPSRSAAPGGIVRGPAAEMHRPPGISGADRGASNAA